MFYGKLQVGFSIVKCVKDFDGFEYEDVIYISREDKVGVASAECLSFESIHVSNS